MSDKKKYPRVVWAHGNYRVVQTSERHVYAERSGRDAMGNVTWASIASTYGREDEWSALAMAIAEKQEKNDAMDRNAMVRAFHEMAGQYIGCLPRVPEDETVRFRLKLILEEVRELVEATFDFAPPPGLREGTNRAANDAEVKNLIGVSGSDDRVLKAAFGLLERIVLLAPVKVDLPAFVDATVDIDYVVEGTRVSFGVDPDPLWVAVHQANLAKRAAVSKSMGDGKVPKPEGWQPPDIRSELIKQGWRPEPETT